MSRTIKGLKPKQVKEILINNRFSVKDTMLSTGLTRRELNDMLLDMDSNDKQLTGNWVLTTNDEILWVNSSIVRMGEYKYLVTKRRWSLEHGYDGHWINPNTIIFNHKKKRKVRKFRRNFRNSILRELGI